MLLGWSEVRRRPRRIVIANIRGSRSSWPAPEGVMSRSTSDWSTGVNELWASLTWALPLACFPAWTFVRRDHLTAPAQVKVSQKLRLGNRKLQTESSQFS